MSIGSKTSAKVTMPETGLALSCFGWPAVHWQGRPIDDINSTKAMALLIYMVCEQRVHARPKLVGLFWSEVDEAKGRVSLRSALYSLTQELPGLLEVTRKTVSIAPTVEVWCDVLALRECLASPNIEVQKQALSLAEDVFLSGFYAKDAPLFDDWANTMRDQLSMLITSRLSSLVTQSAEQRNDRDVVRLGYRLMQLEPYDESVCRSLMLAHGRMREFHKAIGVYRRCQRELQDALGLYPSEETEQTYEKILHARRFPQSAFPASNVSFIGRQREKEELETLLFTERMVVLLGMGGIGKSSLAQAVATSIQTHFLHGAHWLALSGLTRQEEIPLEIAHTLGLRLQRGQPAEEQVLDQLENCELLLVLDNVEQLLDDDKSIEWLHRLLQRAPDVVVFVTSRIALHIKEARTYPLRGLSFASGSESITQRLSQDAAQLLIQTIRRRQPSYDPHDDTDFISDVCRHLEGYPLGIELAAGLILDTDEDERHTRLHELLLDLRSPWANEPERHKSLHGVFHQSWRLLGDKEKALLASFSVFSKGATEKACKHLLGATHRALQTLLDHSLLQRNANRFYIHEALLPSVEQHLQQELRANLERDHGHWFLSRITDEREAQAPLSHAQRTFFAFEPGNIKKAWLWAIQQRAWKLVTDAGFSVYDFFSSEDRAHEGSFWFGDALDAWSFSEDQSSSDESIAYGCILAYRAGLVLRTERLEEAIALAKQAIAQYPESKSSEGLAFAWNVLGQSDIYKGAFSKAKDKLLRANEMYQQLDLTYGRLRPLINLGSACLRNGEFPEAIESLECGLTLGEQLEAQGLDKDEHAIAHILNNLGVIGIIQGHYTDAQSRLESCAAISQRIGYSQLEAAASENLGEIALHNGQPGLALTHAQSSQKKYNEIGDLSGILRTYSTTLPALFEIGGTTRFLPQCIDALEYARRVKKKPMLMGFFTAIVQLLMHCDKPEVARELIAYLTSQAATEQQHLTQLEALRQSLPPEPNQTSPEPTLDPAQQNASQWLVKLKSVFLALHSKQNELS